MEVPATASSTSASGRDTPATVLSKKKEKKAKKVTQKIKIVPGSVDLMVQHTNDDSVVSKRSAVAHRYIEDAFLRHFVTKPSRRSPLINRGYYLRMQVITDVITRCIDQLLQKTATSTDGGRGPVQVISLGAGYDTLAMRLLLPTEGPSGTVSHFATADVQFFDVDFPAVMQSKALLMRAAPTGTFPDDWHVEPESASMPVQSTRYRALGVDLRQAQQDLLPQLQRSCPSFSAANPTVVYAECVMQYMPPEDAAALVHFVAQTFPCALFVAYDQIQPQDSFGRVMQASLRQKNSPLLGITACPDGEGLLRRARDQGMTYATFANFYDLSRHCIAGDERARVEALEPFDEVEEWSEMCEHYGITMASTSPSLQQVCKEQPGFFPSTAATEKEPRPTVAATLRNWPSGRFGFEGWGNGETWAEARADGDVVLVSFGGFSAARQHQRVSTVFAHSMRHGELKVVTASANAAAEFTAGRSPNNSIATSLPAATTAGAAVGSAPPALVFHSVSRLAPCCYVVWGGRTNPGTMNDVAYLLTVILPLAGVASTVTATWQQLRVVAAPSSAATDVDAAAQPTPRCRHCAVAISASQLVVCGGRDAKGSLLNDAWVATVDTAALTITWSPLALHGNVPAPFCSAAATAFSTTEDAGDATLPKRVTSIVVSGGLLANEQCSGAVWTLDVASGECAAVPNVCIGPRFSHTMTRVTVRDQNALQLLVLGGCGCAPKETYPSAVLIEIDPVAKTHDANGSARTTVVALPADCPSWARHSTLSMSERGGLVAVVGGGYTCFSFGTFTAKPTLLQIGGSDQEEGGTVTPSWVAAAASATSEANGAAGETCSSTAALRLLRTPRPPVSELAYTAEVFLAVAADANRPVVFRHVPMGRCVEKWADPAYLKAAEAGNIVSVHVAEGSHLLDFVRKNFTFRHVPFEELVQHTEDAVAHYKTHGTLPHENWYYRSIAAHMKSERANVWRDFSTLGHDFELPDGAREYIMPRVHQSCLRINAPPLQLWTHYDTFDNVLCQVVGRKRVVMFPPSAFNDLYMNGSSSPVLNLDAPDLYQYPRFIDACKSATEVILAPGDMLYFPANWFHHITTLDDTYSISVNVFFNHFDRSDYDPKDLYGNKDIPACVQLRQRIVQAAEQLLQAQRLTETGGPLPVEYAEFALREAIQDLEKLADSMAAARRLSS